MYKNYISIYISGGVDSFFSLLILKYLKYNIIGIHILNWVYNKSKILKLINKICKLINIKFIIFNFKNIYKKKLFYFFLKKYNNKKFINLDIQCNKFIKFFILIKILNKKKIKKVFTGHFSKIFLKNKKYFWKCSFDINRDQNFFLYKIKKKVNIIFILGCNFKVSLKKIFFKYYDNYINKSSKGICFIENKNSIRLNIKKFVYCFLTTYFNKVHKNIYKLYFFKKSNYFKNLIILKKYNLKKKINNNIYVKFKMQNSKYYKICLIRKFKRNKYIIFNKMQKIQHGQDIILYNKKTCFGGFTIN